MKQLLLIFLLLSLIAVAQSQDYSTDLIPQQLRSRATAVVRDEQTIIDMKNENNVIETVSRAVTIFNESGEHHSKISLYYNKSKSIRNIKGAIYDEFGRQVGKFTQKDFKDYSASNDINMFDDVRIKYFSPNPSQYPYTIAYTYEIRHDQNLFIPYWIPNYALDLAVEKSSYQFVCTAAQSLRIKTENIGQATEQTQDKFKSYTWTVNNINAQKSEPYAPIKNAQQICVKIVPQSFQYFKKRGNISDWEELGKWVYEELLKDKQQLPKETRDKIHELTANTSSPKEKAKILYTYLQNKTRYISIQVGIGGLEPFPASYVDRLGYGDCKALVNYMQALLAEVNIESYYCIVEANNRKISIDKDFATVVDGNHIILCIPFENDTTWLECTSNKAPFGYLGDFTDDRLVLACTPDGGKILQTISYDDKNSMQIRKAILHIDETGTIHGTVHTSFTGAQFENHFDNTFANTLEQQKNLKKYYDINEITFPGIKYALQSDREPVLNETLDITIKNYVVKHGKQYILTPNIFNSSHSIPESRDRINALYINRGYTDIDEIELQFFKSLKGNIMPIHKKLDSPMGKYELKISSQDNKITVFRKLQIIDGTYPADNYEKYYEFMKEVYANDRIKYTIALGEE